MESVKSAKVQRLFLYMPSQCLPSGVFCEIHPCRTVTLKHQTPPEAGIENVMPTVACAEASVHFPTLLLWFVHDRRKELLFVSLRFLN